MKYSHFFRIALYILGLFLLQTTPSEADMSAVLRRRHAKPSLGPNPIFKRGSLQSNSDETDASMPPPTAPKRVSFTPPDQRWPTRSGSAADPPTRQRDSGDSDVFLPNYVNLADVRMAQGMERPYGMLVHTRPLPPTPSSNSTSKSTLPSFQYLYTNNFQ